MIVETALFMSVMSDYWTLTLRNTASEPLRAVWKQMATAFNRQIESHHGSSGELWQVLQPPTGTGKTQGLCVYCSLLSVDDHPGVLIVTRLKAQADEVADTINKLAGGRVAVACHSDNRIPASELSSFPVLVITHRAYEIGLDAVSQGDPRASSWSRYHEWGDGQRRLVVIDEALDVIEEAQVDLDTVRYAIGAIPFEVAEQFPQEMEVLATAEHQLTDIARRSNASDGPAKERVLEMGELAFEARMVDLNPLRRALKGASLDRKLLGRNDGEANRRLLGRLDDALKNIQAALKQRAWYAFKMGGHTVNTSRLIIPEDMAGAVVLDATASSNLIYQLFEGKAEVHPVPFGARSYANVTLHVAKGHRVGKTALSKEAKQRSAELVSNLQRSLSKDRRVFVCCHGRVEEQLVSIDTGFSAFEVGHWGAVDGSNKWQDFDTAVIFGLPYRDKVWSANTYMAVQGFQDSDWLNADGDRPFRGHKDIRHALEVGQMVVSIVQALNRVRCRRVIDAHGNCPTTDVFLLLPGDKTGEEVLRGIEKEMPGIKMVDWVYSGGKAKVKRSKYDEALLRYARSMPEGRIVIGEVRETLKAPSRTMDWLRAELKDTSSDLSNRLSALGVRYEVTGQGRGACSYLVKA